MKKVDALNLLTSAPRAICILRTANCAQGRREGEEQEKKGRREGKEEREEEEEERGSSLRGA